MVERKIPLLINVPTVNKPAATSQREVSSLRDDVEAAAEVIRSKVSQDLQHRQKLIEEISDVAMRRSLKDGL